MGVKELCYKIEEVPDLSLNKYASLDGSGVDGVLEKHLAFLRQWNRKGALSGTSVHLYYYYDGQREDGTYAVGLKGSKLKILFTVRGDEEKLNNVPQLVSSSALSDYFKFTPCTFEEFLKECKIEGVSFSVCSTLIKKEVFVRSSLETSSESGVYYTVSHWEMNEDGRLYGMSKLMESLDKQMLYRIDLYSAEKSSDLREALRKPTSVLRERQYSRMGMSGQRDYEAENVIREYDELLDSIDSSPHFIANAFVFANDRENSAVVLDAAGAEALTKGNYEIGTFEGRFTPQSFLGDTTENYYEGLRDRQKKIIVQKGLPGLIICKEEAQTYRMRYLPTLFTLEEAAPFFRFPALYEGEVIQKRKETAPKTVSSEDALFLGTDDNGYEVYFPLENLQKHAFFSGVPGSGKTNLMQHLTSTLWKKHSIPFLLLEPAKREYRALANQKGMEGVYVFSPNADMTFPLHINPFEFPKGLMVAEHIRSLCSVFEGAFPLDNPMPFLLDRAIEAVYREKGWTPETVYTDDTKLQFPTMGMLYKRLEEELESTTYSGEIRGNLESALKVRIGSLLRREMGDIFDVPKSTFPPEKWLTVPAVIELEAMGTGPANFLTLMLCSLIRESLKVNPHHDKEYARHVIFIEEAHNLIGPESEEVSGAEANPKQAATAFIVKMLAEVRALKEGIVIADQLPTVMAQEVLKNTGLKVGLRITSADDRNLLGSTMAASSIQLEEMATFNTGRALISYEGLMRPFTMQTHLWCGDWATQHCSEGVFDIEWCKANCEYYKTGDCEPDEIERRKTVTSLSDTELAERMKDRDVYREICDRSFIIEITKFKLDYDVLLDRVDDVIEKCEEANHLEMNIRNAKAKCAEIVKELSLTPKGETNQELKEELRGICSYVLQLKEEQANGSLSHKKIARLANDAIKDCMKFANRIHNRKKHWKRLGITDLKNSGELIFSGAELTQVQSAAQYINETHGKALLNAQRLLVIAKTHFPDKAAVSIQNSLQEMQVKHRVKTKNILSK